ncbi:glycosyltransferase [Salegentibacter sp. BLCTC]|uniref:glycosyltransferase family 4 protein n=1 Tax=Salegentibacter sp. BLCTC TaxID=2697368 RepID=UPI00187B5085|nr:glycosyltransferase [Salegentibacter sp. BLCTC]MBE7639837.1 glycosyltransferase [Salegentibacter sp. BLCTC]
MKFAVFTHVIHGIKNGSFYAYSPYIREMNLWLKYVDEVEIVAALDEESNKEGEISPQGEYYKHSNITFTEISSFHLLNFLAVLDTLLKIPFIFFRILGAMHRADHLHIRCPGNIGLLAAIAQIFFPKKPKTVKYAGNWDPKATQPLTYKLQKKILGNTFFTRNAKVLVYGDWPQQSDNIFPLFTASFSEKEKELIKKDFKPPYKFIFSGNLVEGKGVDKAIEFIKVLSTNNLDCRLEIYGDGILEKDLRELVENESLKKYVHFKGRVDLATLKEAYRDAHFTLLLSKSEGWPKAIAEGMWYGCIPIATSVSCVPWMLNYGERGVIISDIDQRIKNREKREERRDDKENFLSKQLPDKFHRGRQFECSDESRDVSRTGFSEKDLLEILSLITNPEKLKQMSIAAQKWSQQYTLERFERAIRGMI